MKKIIETIILFCFLASFYSCSSKPVVSMPPKWDYEENAIRLHLKSDPLLNLYQDEPHTLFICVYHLRDPNAFNQLLEENEGISKLLECSRFDASIASSNKLVIQPGQELTEYLDRFEGAKYVGIVAGYFTLQKEHVVRLYPIPLIEEKEGNTTISKPTILNIDLHLGPQKIRDVRWK
jgi:type VI secretion system VasD/TssJ family lipoprotein